MKAHTVPTEEAALEAAIDYLKSISFLDRLVADQPKVTFYDGAEATERHRRKFRDGSVEPMEDWWTVEFPLVEPIPEMEVESRYVIVDAVTGECKLGLP